MRREFKLDEDDIKQAIAKFVGDIHGIVLAPETVTLDAVQRRGQFDEPGFGYYVTATVSEGR